MFAAKEQLSGVEASVVVKPSYGLSDEQVAHMLREERFAPTAANPGGSARHMWVKLPLLENPDILIFAWGATVPMIAHAAGIELDDVTTTWDKWVTPTERKTAKGVIAPGNVAAVRFTINGIYQGETRIQLEHVNRIGTDAAPDWPSGNDDDVYRVDIEGTPSIFQETAFRFTDGSGRDAATAGCLATGLRALNAVPAVNELPPGWVTPLDLPLIPGAGTIR